MEEHGASATLDGDEAGAVLELIDRVARAKDLDEFVRVTMQGLFDLIPSIDVSYNEMNPLAERALYDVYPEPPGTLFEDALPAFERLMRQNPLVAHMEATGDTRTLMWSDFVTVEEIRTTELYHELYRHIGVDSQMAVTLPTPAGIVVGFAVNGDAKGFSERDRAVMNTLRPHLGQAYRAVQLDAELSALRAALGATGWTAALVADDGEVLGITEGGTEALREVDVVVDEGGVLPPLLRDRFVPSIAAYRDTHPAVLSDPIRLSDGAGGVAGWYVPSPVPPHVVLFRGATDLDPTPLTDAGLTPREIDVALALGEGGTNAQLAVRLGMAEGTLRKHLQRIFEVLEVDNRASAAATIGRLVAPA